MVGYLTKITVTITKSRKVFLFVRCSFLDMLLMKARGILIFVTPWDNQKRLGVKPLILYKGQLIENRQSIKNDRYFIWILIIFFLKNIKGLLE